MFSTITEALEFYRMKCREYVIYKIRLHEAYGSHIPFVYLQDEICRKQEKLKIMESVLGLTEAEATMIKNEFGTDLFPQADPKF